MLRDQPIISHRQCHHPHLTPLKLSLPASDMSKGYVKFGMLCPLLADAYESTRDWTDGGSFLTDLRTKWTPTGIAVTLSSQRAAYVS